MPDIAKLLWPQSVAIIGASSDTRGLRGRIVQIMRSHPYAGAVYPVSRSETEVQGLKAYKSVADLPARPISPALIIPAKFVPQELERCGEAGIKAAIILSLRLRRGEGRDGSRAAERDPGDREEIRHGGERAEWRGLCQHRGRAVPDLQSRDGRGRRAAVAARRIARAGRSR